MTTVALSIPPRQQWVERNGYCGECAIQQAALYYGTYVSQKIVRSIINPDQNHQLLIGINEKQVLNALQLRLMEFNNIIPQPQFKTYFDWIKTQLNLNYPVIITCYDKGATDPDYDHIMLATGFVANSVTVYSPADSLLFNNMFLNSTVTRVAHTLPDIRAMLVNGATNFRCIPSLVDYGCAVLGIRVDVGNTTFPVSINVPSWSEPDVTMGQTAATWTATVTVSNLVNGQRYSLLRYNDYTQVPKANFLSSSFSTIETFTASGSTHVVSKQIVSDRFCTFRCVPAV